MWLLICLGIVIAAVAYVATMTILAANAKRGHNDRDCGCRYWWGDRRGYDIRAERCPICNPKENQ